MDTHIIILSKFRDRVLVAIILKKVEKKRKIAPKTTQSCKKFFSEKNNKLESVISEIFSFGQC